MEAEDHDNTAAGGEPEVKCVVNEKGNLKV